MQSLSPTSVMAQGTAKAPLLWHNNQKYCDLCAVETDTTSSGGLWQEVSRSKQREISLSLQVKGTVIIK